MRDRIVLYGLTLAALSVSCNGAASMTAPTPASPRPLSISVQAVVVGTGFAGAYGEGVRLSIWAGSPATASARLEMEFADGSAAVGVPFDPVSVRVAADARGTLSASVPDPSDPRLGGRRATSFKAAVTVRDDAGSEQTVFVNLSIAQR